MESRIKALELKLATRHLWLKVTGGILVAVAFILMAGVAIAALVVNANGQALQRYAVIGNGFTGQISMDINSGQLSWSLQYVPPQGAVNTFYIMGPIPPGSSTGPLDLAVCGSPSSLACDNSVPYVLKGSIMQYGSSGLVNYMTVIRQNPAFFYVLINGNVTVQLGAITGTS